MITEERIQKLEKKISCLLKKRSVKVLPTGDYTVIDGDAELIIGTAAANAADITLPNPVGNKRRRITITNESGNSQNVLSHDGTSLTIKTSSGAAVATLAMPNAAAATTAGARLAFVSDGTLWHVVP